MGSIRWGIATVISLQLMSCSQAPAFDAKDVHLSQTDPAHDSITYALGLVKGTLTVEAGCVRFASEERGTLTPVFPPDYTAANEGRDLVIKSGSGRTLYTIGKPGDLGGSTLPDEAAERLIPAESRERCPGPYYLVLPRHEEDGARG